MKWRNIIWWNGIWVAIYASARPTLKCVLVFGYSMIRLLLDMELISNCFSQHIQLGLRSLKWRPFTGKGILIINSIRSNDRIRLLKKSLQQYYNNTASFPRLESRHINAKVTGWKARPKVGQTPVGLYFVLTANSSGLALNKLVPYWELRPHESLLQ